MILLGEDGYARRNHRLQGSCSCRREIGGEWRTLSSAVTCHNARPLAGSSSYPCGTPLTDCEATFRRPFSGRRYMRCSYQGRTLRTMRPCPRFPNGWRRSYGYSNQMGYQTSDFRLLWTITPNPPPTPTPFLPPPPPCQTSPPPPPHVPQYQTCPLSPHP